MDIGWVHLYDMIPSYSSITVCYGEEHSLENYCLGWGERQCRAAAYRPGAVWGWASANSTVVWDNSACYGGLCNNSRRHLAKINMTAVADHVKLEIFLAASGTQPTILLVAQIYCFGLLLCFRNLHKATGVSMT